MCSEPRPSWNMNHEIRNIIIQPAFIWRNLHSNAAIPGLLSGSRLCRCLSEWKIVGRRHLCCQMAWGCMRGIAVINCPAQTKRISELVKTSSFKVRQNPQTVVGFSSVQRIMMSQTLRQFMALNIQQFIVSGESIAWGFGCSHCTRQAQCQNKYLQSNILFFSKSSPPVSVMMGQMLNFVSTHTHTPHSCLVVSNVTKTAWSWGWISNVDAHTRVLAADTVRRAPDNVILCR